MLLTSIQLGLVSMRDANQEMIRCIVTGARVYMKVGHANEVLKCDLLTVILSGDAKLITSLDLRMVEQCLMLVGRQLVLIWGFLR